MESKKVLVIGGGIAGITSALELAPHGYDVFLVEKKPTIGGHVAAYCCKATEQCNRCSVCLLPEKMGEIGVNPRISILTRSEVTQVGGKAGDFQVKILRRPPLVDPQRCTACRLCEAACPVDPPKAIRFPIPKAIPAALAIDPDRCLRLRGEDCRACQDHCPKGAIHLDPRPQAMDLEVGAIVVAAGFEAFDAREKGLLGYREHPHVLTGLDVEERFLREGVFHLPLNGKIPQNVAFIQCLGSRDEHIGKGYCSKVCCKYAVRLSKLLKYHEPQTRVTIFKMDLQTAGKGFQEVWGEAEKNIRFISGIPVEVLEGPAGQLRVRYEDLLQERMIREDFDLVVLSVGITARKDAKHLARILGINQGDFGFFESPTPLDNTRTQVEGIFLAGCCQGPKDIIETIAHSTQAAMRVRGMLG